MVAEPLKFSDLFGSLSISKSPYYFVAWSSVISLWMVREKSLWLALFGLAVPILIYCVYRSSRDSIAESPTDLLLEFRFIFGSGCSSALLAIAFLAIDTKSDNYPRFFVGLFVTLAQVVALVPFSRRKRVPAAAPSFHNFTQSVLISVAPLTGILVSLDVPTGSSDSERHLVFVSWIYLFTLFPLWVISIASFRRKLATLAFTEDLGAQVAEPRLSESG